MAEKELSIDNLAKVFVKDFPLPHRIKSCLIDNGFIELDDIKTLSLDQLKDIDGLGQKGISELRDYLYSKYKIVIKRTAKEKKKRLDNSNDAKAVVIHLLGDNVNDWGRQLIAANQLIKLFGVNLLKLVKPNPSVYSLIWYLQPYGQDYIKKFIPVTIVEEKSESKESVEISTNDSIFVPVVSNKPKNIRDFLNVR